MLVLNHLDHHLFGRSRPPQARLVTLARRDDPPPLADLPPVGRTERTGLLHQPPKHRSVHRIDISCERTAFNTFNTCAALRT
jgi:hypothetical protein